MYRCLAKRNLLSISHECDTAGEWIFTTYKETSNFKTSYQKSLAFQVSSNIG